MTSNVEPTAPDDKPDYWVLFFDGGDEFGDVWVYKAPGDELPPASILAAAIADAISGNNPE